MQLAKHTIWIDRSRDDVFAFFLDFPQAARWRQYVQSMAVVGPEPLRVGSRIRTVIDLNGGRHEFDLEVLAFEPPSLWRHRTFETDFKGHIEYRFETEGTGTRVTLTIRVEPATVYGWLALPIMWISRTKPYTEQLPHLKRVMEESPAALAALE
jgi:uncharacterized protein YndB with AHSA1/START domain